MDKSVDDNSPRYVNIRFRFYVRSNSVDSETLNYLKSCSREANNMMLEAVRPYWMAVACRDLGFVAGEALSKLAVSAVSALCSRARYLCATFDLDPAAFGLSVVGPVTPCSPQVQIPTAMPLTSIEATNSDTAAFEQVQNRVEDGVNDVEESFDEDEIEAFSFYASSANLHFNTAGL